MQETNSIEDFELPKTIINRVLKSSLPEGALFQKDAKLAFSKSGTVFINFITALAQDLAKQANLKTLTPEMIYKALELSDFEHLVPKVKETLISHKENLKLKKSKKSLDDSNMEDSMSNIIPETPIDSTSANDDESVIVEKKIY